LEKIKVAIIDDHTILRQVLVKALNMEFDMEVIGSWKTAEEAIEFLERETLDVVILDMKLPGMNGIEATRRIREINPAIKVIILSAFTGNDEIFGAIEAGGLGYLPKDITVEALVDAIRQVYRGYAVLDPTITRIVLERFSDMESRLSNATELTGIEKQILSLASDGCSNKEIAQKMEIKENAVKCHFRDILKKLDARDRTHAVAIALKSGLIE